MFSILDGRNEFYQWDLNRQIKVEDNTITELHFSNRTDNCALVVNVVDGVANVPNILLQESYDIRVYGYCADYTKVEKRFKVVARSKPSDYVYTETEIKDYNDLEQRVNNLEKNSGKTLVVSIQDGVPSHGTAYIYNFVRNGGNVVLLIDGMYLSLTSISEDTATFDYIGDDYVSYQYTLIGDEVYTTEMLYASTSNLNILEETVGDIENALNEIIVIQEELIGIIQFHINRLEKTTYYNALSGMTWADWCDSEYNTDGYYYETTTNKVYHQTQDIVGYEGVAVKSTDLIIDGYGYDGDM